MSAFLQYPHERVLLPRTKLAYVHLHNLLTDAKRDRAARVFGYVEVVLPEETLLLFLQEGELVNASRLTSGVPRIVPIARALAEVPAAPESGEVCFHEADDEQLACMHFTHAAPPEPWPAELQAHQPDALFPFLMATTFDGVVELAEEGCIHYLILRDGTVERAYLAGDGRGATIPDRVSRLFGGRRLTVRRWPVPPPLPVQASPKLVRAYRELSGALLRRLVQAGQEGAPSVAEHARRHLVPQHPALEAFVQSVEPNDDPVQDAAAVTAAVAAWVREILWTSGDPDQDPDALLKELTWERRHVFQSAGFFDRLGWTLGA